jgi:hypothetical protein
MSNLGLYYYKARFYSPALGRFLQTDPIGFADDTNLYAYVGNNPINLTDPTGLAAYDGGFGGTYQQPSTVVNSATSNWLPNNYSNTLIAQAQLPAGVKRFDWAVSPVLGMTDPAGATYLISPPLAGSTPSAPGAVPTIFRSQKAACFGLDCVGSVNPGTGNFSFGVGKVLPFPGGAAFTNVQIHVPVTNTTGKGYFGVSVNGGALRLVPGNPKGKSFQERTATPAGITVQGRVNFPAVNPSACLYADRC